MGDKILLADEHSRFTIPGELVNMGAHVSLVRYSRTGIDFEVWMDNDEFIITEEDN